MSGTAVLGYLGGVRRALADVPPAEQNELMADVEDCLLDIANEAGPALTAQGLRDRLGSPDDYAAELVRAAGYGERVPEAQPQPATDLDKSTWRLALFLVGAAVLLAGTAGSVIGGFVYGNGVGFLLAVFAFFGLLIAGGQCLTAADRNARWAHLRSTATKVKRELRARSAPASPTTGTSS
ncbi:HAAS signaling domain-containing protein [Tenggerimyces flavus]|uniref:DUF1707 domain-containing protein n=1 Tax=Tenggerimyces flavus TaxID=1708749 RepID=A0ABV7Y5A3_9ACTN|nr:hypothetical protein [Tenggerimyces flavus]MBM7790713.1 putative membrane protein [Tenggerimyces flavus]